MVFVRMALQSASAKASFVAGVRMVLKSARVMDHRKMNALRQSAAVGRTLAACVTMVSSYVGGVQGGTDSHHRKVSASQPSAAVGRTLAACEMTVLSPAGALTGTKPHLKMNQSFRASLMCGG